MYQSLFSYQIIHCKICKTNYLILTFCSAYGYMLLFIILIVFYSVMIQTNVFNVLLQILGVTSDMSVFDPGNGVAAEFYVSLHELMSALEPKSGLLWCAIGVLQHACHNPVARRALVHTYRFVPILSRLLDSNLIQEKRTRVLQLLQVIHVWVMLHLIYSSSYYSFQQNFTVQ